MEEAENREPRKGERFSDASKSKTSRFKPCLPTKGRQGLTGVVLRKGARSANDLLRQRKEENLAEIIKFQAGEILQHIRHDMREIPAGKKYGNESIVREKSIENYSLLDRCRTAKEANEYRKKLEKEIFAYNRKNLVHAVEVVIQCPKDCPEEQKNDFFRESYNYVCSTLPMGEKCVFVAQVHVDEKHFSPSGEMISKEHLHLMYVPAVPDQKHAGFSYRLCADQLTKKARLKEFHPGLQKHLNDAGIKATVFSKKEGEGKSISLTADQLKEITAKTGVVFKKSITVDQLVNLLKDNEILLKDNAQLRERLRDAEKELEAVKAENEKLKDASKSNEWGNHDAWGKSNSWGSDKTWGENKTW